LRVNQIDALRIVRFVRDAHVPKPRRRIRSQSQLDLVAKPLPTTIADQRARRRRRAKNRGTARAQQRHELGRRRAAQVDVRGPALDLIAQK
jgi:hypothetical protein